MPASPQADPPGGLPLHVTLLGAFELTVGGVPCPVGRGPSRLVALLALNRRGLSRADAAAMLTPHLEPDSARGSLRRQLARLRGRAPAELVEERDGRLRLAPRVTVDVEEAEALASRVAAGATAEADAEIGERLTLELLPGWDDGWLLPERARVADLFLNALEVHARRLERRGDRDAALATVHRMLHADPLWEGAVGVQLEIYRAQWNRAKVARRFLAFRERLRGELGIEPSPELRALVVRLLTDGGESR